MESLIVLLFAMHTHESAIAMLCFTMSARSGNAPVDVCVPKRIRKKRAVSCVATNTLHTLSTPKIAGSHHMAKIVFQ